MFLPLDPRSEGTEDVFRALGALLDDRGATGVLLMEISEGILVRARVELDERGRPGWLPGVPLERAFDGPAMLAVVLDGMRRRGTDHRAGPIERDLRLIGRLIAEGGWEDIVVIQDGPRWIIRYGDPETGQGAVRTFDEARLLLVEADAVARRGSSVEVAAG